ncbi:MAG: HypC/HybG/HupF family hydrogenase formation chaperone, partial [Bacillota bacterium]|nr:HypC/HybG/HupF family hydrogenase formation chaperone [Bacillota bacterium]
PGKIISIEGSKAKVDFQGNTVSVSLGLVDAAPGQYVLVHAGCAIQVMEKEQARELLDIYEDMEALLERPEA